MTAITMVLVQLGCATQPDNALQLCRGNSGNQCNGEDCFSVACLDSPSPSNDCTVNPHHGGLSIMRTERIATVQETCIAAGGEWYQSQVEECAEMDGLSGAAYEIEVGCFFE